MQPGLTLLPSIGRVAQMDLSLLSDDLSTAQWATFVSEALWITAFDEALGLEQVGHESGLGCARWHISDEADHIVEHYLAVFTALAPARLEEIANFITAAGCGGAQSLPGAALRQRLALRKLQGTGALSAQEVSELTMRFPRCAALPLKAGSSLAASLHVLVWLLLEQWRYSKENARQAMLNVVKTVAGHGGVAATEDCVRVIVETLLSAALQSSPTRGDPGSSSQFAVLLLCSLCECRHHQLETVSAYFCTATLTACSSVYEVLLAADGASHGVGTHLNELRGCQSGILDRALYLVFPCLISQFGFEWCWSGWQRMSRRMVNASSVDRRHAEKVMRTLVRETYRRGYLSRLQQVLPASVQNQFLDEIAADALETFSLSASQHPCPEGALAVMNFLGRSGSRTVASEFRDAVESAVSVTPQFIQLAASSSVDSHERTTRMARMRFCVAMSAIVLVTQGRRRSHFQHLLEMADPVLAAYLVLCSGSAGQSTTLGYNAIAEVACGVGCHRRDELTRRFLEMLEASYLAVDQKKLALSSTISSADFLFVLKKCLDVESKNLYAPEAVELGWARELLERLRWRILAFLRGEKSLLLSSDSEHTLLLELELKNFEEGSGLM